MKVHGCGIFDALEHERAEAVPVAHPSAFALDVEQALDMVVGHGSLATVACVGVEANAVFARSAVHVVGDLELAAGSAAGLEEAAAVSAVSALAFAALAGQVAGQVHQHRECLATLDSAWPYLELAVLVWFERASPPRPPLSSSFSAPRSCLAWHVAVPTASSPSAYPKSRHRPPA